MDHSLPSLDSLGLRFRTDKASGQHDYLSFYETFLSPLREQVVKVLEIGVLFGSSLRMWEAYFQNGTIIGADIHPGVTSFTSDRVRTDVIDQSNLEDLVSIGMEHGPFDLIIEDGSHRWDHQIVTLKTLFPFLKPDGFYIIEDLQTNFGDLAKSYRGNASLSCVEYLKKLIDLRVADTEIDIASEEDAFLRTYARQISSVTFFRHACVIAKRYRAGLPNLAMLGRLAPDAATASLIPLASGPTAVPVSLACHISGVGDLRSDTGAIRSLDESHEIQGFVICGEAQPVCDLAYRARLADGNWTEWLGCGGFAGTMGLSRSLTGFSARLTPGDAAVWKLDVVGLFRGLTSPVLVSDGEACVAPSGKGSLYGMQVRIVPR